jgi:hypothetical protein
MAHFARLRGHSLFETAAVARCGKEGVVSGPPIGVCTGSD